MRHSFCSPRLPRWSCRIVGHSFVLVSRNRRRPEIVKLIGFRDAGHTSMVEQVFETYWCSRCDETRSEAFDEVKTSEEPK
ncbi:MAG: hypothetical protein DRP64_14880 [Verrucomicrobia bacterium]|nr:MAG: hypothetical protein DRP64_14880 [Verrucomicrobiota bacterium]